MKRQKRFLLFHNLMLYRSLDTFMSHESCDPKSIIRMSIRMSIKIISVKLVEMKLNWVFWWFETFFIRHRVYNRKTCWKQPNFKTNKASRNRLFIVCTEKFSTKSHVIDKRSPSGSLLYIQMIIDINDIGSWRLYILFHWECNNIT